MITQKLRGAKLRRKAQGFKADGVYPYGQYPQRPGESAVLVRMRQMHADGICTTELQKETER